MSIYRKIIEILRIESNLSIAELVDGICSVPLYYAYRAGTKTISNDKLNLIKNKVDLKKIYPSQEDNIKNNLNQFYEILLSPSSVNKSIIAKYYKKLYDKSKVYLSSPKYITKFLITILIYEIFYSNTDRIHKHVIYLKNLEELLTDFEKVQFYEVYGSYHKINVNYYKSNYYYKKAIDIANEKGIIYPRAYTSYALSLATNFQFNDAFENINIALSQLTQNINLLFNLEALIVKGVILRFSGKYDEAIEEFIKVNEISKQIKFNRLDYLVFINVGECYFNKEDYLKAYSNIVKGLRSFEGDRMFNGYYRAVRSLIISADKLGHIDEKNELIKDALGLIDNRPYKGVDLGILKLFLYEENKDYHKFEKLLSQLINFYQNTEGYINFYIETLEIGIDYYKKQKKYKKVADLLENYKNIFMKIFM